MAATDADSARGAAILVFVWTSILLALLAFYGLVQLRGAESDTRDSALADALLLARAVESDAAGNAPSTLDLAAVVSELRLDVASAVYAADGTRVAEAAAPGTETLLAAFPASAPAASPEARWRPVAYGGTSANVLVVRLRDGGTLAVAPRAQAAVSWTRTLVAAQALTILVAIVGAAFVVRRVRRAVSAANASTGGEAVGPASARSEADFVVETFHSVIGELQVKERELERRRLIERDRAERSERFSERVIAQMPTGLVVVDHQGIVTAANPSAREIFPTLPAGRVQSVRHEDAFRAAPDLVRMISECLREGTVFQRHEVECRGPSGALDAERAADEYAAGARSARCLGVAVSPLAPPDGRPEGALCLMTDLTEVVALRDRVRLKENLASLGEMAAGLTHELKNSLATIQGYSQLLARLAPGEAAAPSKALVEEVRYLSQMVTDFLNFARPDELHLLAVPVADLLRDVVARVRARAEEADIALSVDLEPELESASVLGDETMLARALLNIALNAVEVLEGAQRPRRLSVRAGVVDGEVAVEVSDSGPGIPAEDLSRIFIPFFTTKSRGHGIGLALTQKILLTHRGRITVESDASGTMFRCHLPVDKN